MQLESFKVFCDLAESGSFTSAARISGITQSAVSQQIGGLEKHFNTLLIERSKKMFRLTKEGQLLYDHSKEIMNTYEKLNSEMQALWFLGIFAYQPFTLLVFIRYPHI